MKQYNNVHKLPHFIPSLRNFPDMIIVEGINKNDRVVPIFKEKTNVTK